MIQDQQANTTMTDSNANDAPSTVQDVDSTKGRVENESQVMSAPSRAASAVEPKPLLVQDNTATNATPMASSNDGEGSSPLATTAGDHITSTEVGGEQGAMPGDMTVATTNTVATDSSSGMLYPGQAASTIATSLMTTSVSTEDAETLMMMVGGTATIASVATSDTSEPTPLQTTTVSAVAPDGTAASTSVPESTDTTMASTGAPATTGVTHMAVESPLVAVANVAAATLDEQQQQQQQTDTSTTTPATGSEPTNPMNKADTDTATPAAPSADTTDVAMADATSTLASTTPAASTSTAVTVASHPDFVSADAIWEPNENDVLNGRGASINGHKGNQKFRALCFARKPLFDAGNHAVKRRVAIEVVSLTKALPGRFLKRLNTVVSSTPAASANGAATPANNASNSTNSSTNKGPWYELTTEKAILKACQVMRDFRRPDRVAHREMLESQGGGIRKRQRSTESTPGFNMSTPLAPADPVKENPFGVHDHDVLCGRGAFVNGHIGNERFRKLALARKPDFDTGNYAKKRELATEIVTFIKTSLNPPGRFLKRVGSQGKAVKASEETWTWEELTDDRAIHKACQVMRDISRPDRMKHLPMATVVPAGGTTTTTTPTTNPAASTAAAASVVAAATAAVAAASAEMDTSDQKPESQDSQQTLTTEKGLSSAAVAEAPSQASGAMEVELATVTTTALTATTTETGTNEGGAVLPNASMTAATVVTGPLATTTNAGGTTSQSDPSTVPSEQGEGAGTLNVLQDLLPSPVANTTATLNPTTGTGDIQQQQELFQKEQDV